MLRDQLQPASSSWVAIDERRRAVRLRETALTMPDPVAKPHTNGGQAAFFIARLAPSLLGLVTTLVLTRLLGPASYGLYAVGLTAVFIMTTGGFEWLGLSMIRLAPSAQTQPAFLDTVVGCFLLMAVGFAVIALAIALQQHSLHMSLLILACWCAGLASSWTELKQRLQMIEFRVRSYLITGLVRGITCMVLVLTTATLTSNAVATLFALALATYMGGLLERRPNIQLRRLDFDRRIARDLMVFGLPLTACVGLGTVRQSIDKWLLQALSGPESVGLFAAVTVITQMPIQTLAGCIGPSGYASAVRVLETNDPRAVRTELGRNLIFLLTLLLPATAGIVAVSHEAAVVLLAPVYWANVGRIAPWLAISALLAGLRGFYIDYAFQLAHQTKTLTWITLIGVVVNAVLDYFLIPQWGELGAAVGGCVASASSLLAGVIASRRAFPLPLPLGPTVKVLLATCLMYLVVIALPGSATFLSLLRRVAVGGFCYSTCIVVFDVLDCRAWLAGKLPGWLRRRSPRTIPGRQ